jgi:hypothetical protein
VNEAEYHAASQLTEWGIASLYCDQNGFDDAEIAVRQAFYGTPFASVNLRCHASKVSGVTIVAIWESHFAPTLFAFTANRRRCSSVN